jgi:hypothetical protein
MDVLSAGHSTGGNACGNVDYTLNVDTEERACESAAIA